MIKIAPSILSCDFARLGEEAAAIQAAGGDWLHVDVMDGHFVPNISLGIPVVQSLRKATNMPLDVHLMISDPGAYIPQFAKAGSDWITFHVESEGDPVKNIQLIHSLGVKAGISISPDTPVQVLDPLLTLVDLVLVMTVRPGFGGQSFMADMMDKLDYITKKCLQLGISPQLEVDGGISRETAGIAAAHGARILVAGSAVFGKPDYRVAIDEIRQAALAHC